MLSCNHTTSRGLLFILLSFNLPPELIYHLYHASYDTNNQGDIDVIKYISLTNKDKNTINIHMIHEEGSVFPLPFF